MHKDPTEVMLMQSEIIVGQQKIIEHLVYLISISDIELDVDTADEIRSLKNISTDIS